MNPITLDSLPLWNIAYSIRIHVQSSSFYYSAHPIPDAESLTIISAVEQIYLTEGMMQSFLREPEPNEIFAADMRKWGIVQALVVQQDAVDFLALAVNCPQLRPKQHSDLRVIREDLRNRYVGHPVVDRDSTKFVVTASSGNHEACFLELSSGDLSVRRFDLRKAIELQRKILNEFLAQTRDRIMSEEELYREQLREASPLDVVLHSTFDYNIEKAFPNEQYQAGHFSEEIVRQVETFRQAFEAVGRLNEIVGGDVSAMEYAALQVKLFHSSAEADRRFTDQDVRIFLGFLSHTYRRLQEYAREIREELNWKAET